MSNYITTRPYLHCLGIKVIESLKSLINMFIGINDADINNFLSDIKAGTVHSISY